MDGWMDGWISVLVEILDERYPRLLETYVGKIPKLTLCWLKNTISCLEIAKSETVRYGNTFSKQTF